jgi:hypothetical protein
MACDRYLRRPSLEVRLFYPASRRRNDHVTSKVAENLRPRCHFVDPERVGGTASLPGIPRPSIHRWSRDSGTWKGDVENPPSCSSPSHRDRIQ